jgi:hypothetical protein
MKRYTDLTMEELNALTDAEIRKFIDIEVAFAGIQMVTKPLPIETSRIAIVPTVSAYHVKGVLVEDLEVAKVLQGAVIFTPNYVYPDYDRKYLDEKTDVGIETQQFYRKEELEQVKGQVAAAKEAETTFKEANKAYCECQQQIDAFQHEVMGAVSNARHVVYQRQQAQAAYDRYLDLADGNEEIAAKFFRDAFKGQADVLYYVLGDPLPKVVPEAEAGEEAA